MGVKQLSPSLPHSSKRDSLSEAPSGHHQVKTRSCISHGEEERTPLSHLPYMACEFQPGTALLPVGHNPEQPRAAQ